MSFNRKTVILLVIILTFCIPSYSCKNNNNNSKPLLTYKELKLIDDYVDSMSIEDAVGQILMVGIPGDIKNYYNNKNISCILFDLGIGNLIGNTYNYHDDQYSDSRRKTHYQNIINFHNYLQAEAKRKNPKIPLLIAADFEGPKYSAIDQGVFTPPEALTLSTTGNGDLIYRTGLMVGTQLRDMGFQILLGPVLDIDLTSQGDYKTAVANRSFGCNFKRVYTAASYYIKGIRETGIICIGKHYPGHGAVNGNPHDNKMIPVFNGSPENLADQIQPFVKLASYLNGVMTAHVNISFMEPNNSGPVTFSRKFVMELIRNKDTVNILNTTVYGCGYKKQIIITDDLSDTGAILKYMASSKKDFKQVAAEAFDAGHDILLFSHVEFPNQKQRGRYGKFTISELKKVKNYLIEYISQSREKTKQLRDSVKRIIKTKAEINKVISMSNVDIETSRQVFTKKDVDWSKPPDISDITNTQILSGQFKDSDELIYKILDQSYTLIRKGIGFNLYSIPSTTKIAFCVDEGFMNLYKMAFQKRFPSSTFYPLPRLKEKWYESGKKIISDYLRNYDYLILTVSDLDDRNLLDYLRIKSPEEFSKKTIILLHTTPTILTDDVLSKATILGTFSSHPFSYEKDIEVLNGTIMPRDNETCHHLPISLGSNFKYFNANQYEPSMSVAEGIKYLPYYATVNEVDYANKIERLKNIIWVVSLSCVSLIMVIIFLLLRWYKGKKVDGKWFRNFDNDRVYKIISVGMFGFSIIAGYYFINSLSEAIKVQDLSLRPQDMTETFLRAIIMEKKCLNSLFFTITTFAIGIISLKGVRSFLKGIVYYFIKK